MALVMSKMLVLHHPNEFFERPGYEFTSCWRNRWKVLLIQKARVLEEDEREMDHGGSEPSPVVGDGHEPQ